jgi:hypothetical protein
MSRQLKTAAAGFTNAVSKRIKGKPRYATVQSVTPDDKGATNFVNVVIDGGTPKQNIPSGFNLTEGARVLLRGDGLAGSESFVVERPIRTAPSERGNNPNVVIETPIIAGFKHYQEQILGGAILLYVAIIVWQIQAQWRNGVAVGYEMQMRQVTGNMPSETLTLDPQRQMLIKLDGAIDNNDTTIQVEAVGGNVPAEASFLPARFGYVEVGGEMMFYDEYRFQDELLLVQREQDTPQGLPTTAVSHTDGMLVRGRSVLFSHIVSPTGSNLEYRVRAVIGQQASNWGDWELYKAPAVIPAEQRTADLITNGSFDSNTTGWAAVSIGTLSHDPVRGSLGAGCAVIEEDGDSSPTSTNFYQGSISITGGMRYVLQMSVSTRGDIEAIDEFYAQVALGGVAGIYKSAKVLGANMPDLDDNRWIVFHAEGVAPKEATEATVSLVAELNRGIGETSFIYIDDVQLYKIEQTSGIATEAGADFVRLGAGGGEGAITKIVHYETTWNPGTVVSESYITHTITGVSGIAAGDHAKPGFTALGDNDMELTATVTGTGRIFVVLRNFEGGNIDLSSGTLSIEITRSEA